MDSRHLRSLDTTDLLKRCLEGVMTLPGRSLQPNQLAVAYILSGVEKVKIYHTVTLLPHVGAVDMAYIGEFLEDVIMNILPSEGLPSIRLEAICPLTSKYKVVFVASQDPNCANRYIFDVPCIPLLLLKDPRLIIDIPSVASRNIECDLGLVYLPMSLHKLVASQPIGD